MLQECLSRNFESSPGTGWIINLSSDGSQETSPLKSSWTLSWSDSECNFIHSVGADGSHPKKNLFSRKMLTLKTQQKNRPDDVVNEGVNEGAMNLKITLCKRTSSFQMTCIISEAHILIYPAFSLTYTCMPSFIGGQMQSNYRWLKKIIIIKSSKKEIYIYIYIYIYTHCM